MSLPTYSNGDNDQPVVCPKCGSRTDWEENTEFLEYSETHDCLNLKCGHKFFMLYDTDD